MNRFCPAARCLAHSIWLLLPFLTMPEVKAAPATLDTSAAWPILNAKFTYPQTFSGELGLIVGREVPECVEGLFLSVEPGLGGTKVNAGYGGYNYSCFGGGRIGISYFRASGDEAGLSEGDEFFGLQAAGSALLLAGSIGAYYNPDDHRFLLSVGIGIGM